MTTSGFLQEIQSIHDYMNIPKIEFIFLVSYKNQPAASIQNVKKYLRNVHVPALLLLIPSLS